MCLQGDSIICVQGDSGDFTTRPEKSSGGSGPSAAGSSKPGGSEFSNDSHSKQV